MLPYLDYNHGSILILTNVIKYSSIIVMDKLMNFHGQSGQETFRHIFSHKYSA